MPKRQRSLPKIAADVRLYLERRKLTQMQLAKAVGVSQSQVSRLLAGRGRRLSRAILQICRYADITTHLTRSADPRKSEILVQALGKVWNGTDAHAKSIARVVSALEDFGHRE